MAKKEIIKVKDVLRELLKQKGISINKIFVFGSYAKGTEREDSDIDIIVASKVFRGTSIFLVPLPFVIMKKEFSPPLVKQSSFR
ncbi:MAG: nucleotidyltransferase domain-containing protein [Deltaproteobacteria bacterium]|nr:nucleotidyltransferase domain-containing protein [Deltaproteobacteria bacterium]MCL5278200.1 nucleotidyltransferase domain-containing protein [Deltaproteobacteria bacterium]